MVHYKRNGKLYRQVMLVLDTQVIYKRTVYKRNQILLQGIGEMDNSVNITVFSLKFRTLNLMIKMEN